MVVRWRGRRGPCLQMKVVQACKFMLLSIDTSISATDFIVCVDVSVSFFEHSTYYYKRILSISQRLTHQSLERHKGDSMHDLTRRMSPQSVATSPIFLSPHRQDSRKWSGESSNLLHRAGSGPVFCRHVIDRKLRWTTKPKRPINSLSHLEKMTEWKYILSREAGLPFLLQPLSLHLF